jgi:hypothetical protein
MILVRLVEYILHTADTISPPSDSLNTVAQLQAPEIRAPRSISHRAGKYGAA